MLIGCVVIDQMGIACERARFPHLEGEPFALVEGGAKSLLRAVSSEAAACGVAAGQTASGARTLCSDLLIVLHYDHTVYEAAARTIWDLLAVVSDTVEPVSPEMAFMVLSERYAERDTARLSRVLARAIGVPVRIGVGRSKFVAEHAARAGAGEKGSGPIFVPVGEEAALLASLPVARIADLPRRITGRVILDRQMLLRLERLGIRTLGDALSLPLNRLPRQFRATGQLLRDLAYGVDRDPVRPSWPPRCIAEETHFDEGIDNRFLTEQALSPLAHRVACLLSKEVLFARTLSVRVGLRDGTYIENRDRFVVPLSRSDDLHRHSLRLLSTLLVNQPIVSLSLIAGELGAGSGAQLALPALADARKMPAEVRRLRLDAALDYLRREFGLRAVMTGDQLLRSRRASLYGAVPLGHLLADTIRVATNREGRPVHYWRRQRGRREEHRYEVRRIADRWRESRWRADLTVTDIEVWRIESDPFGISDLRRMGAQWQFVATLD